MGSGEGEEGETEESSEDETNPLSRFDPRGPSLDYEEDDQVTKNNGGSGIGNREGGEGEFKEPDPTINNGGSGSGSGSGEGEEGEPKEPGLREPDQLSQYPRSLTTERSIMTAAPHSTETTVRYDTAQTAKSPEVARKLIFSYFHPLGGGGEARIFSVTEVFETLPKWKPIKNVVLPLNYTSLMTIPQVIRPGWCL